MLIMNYDCDALLDTRQCIIRKRVYEDKTGTRAVITARLPNDGEEIEILHSYDVGDDTADPLEVVERVWWEIADRVTDGDEYMYIRKCVNDVVREEKNKKCTTNARQQTGDSRPSGTGMYSSGLEETTES